MVDAAKESSVSGASICSSVPTTATPDALSNTSEILSSPALSAMSTPRCAPDECIEALAADQTGGPAVPSMTLGTAKAYTPACELKVGACTRQGTKGNHNQDTYLVIPFGKTRMLAAVFDGHGLYGHIAAHRARDVFANEAKRLIPDSSVELYENDARSILLQLFEAARVAIINERDAQGLPMAWYSGTTATAAIVDTGSGKLAVAHVGDSSLVLFGNSTVQFRTRDHVVDEAAELRVRACGGEVRTATVCGITARRIFGKGTGMPGLMMDRSLGDLYAHQLGLLHTPEISSGICFTPGSTLIVASDGIWEERPADSALACIAPFSDAQQAASTLVETTRAAYKSNVIDDITAVVVMAVPSCSNTMARTN